MSQLVDLAETPTNPRDNPMILSGLQHGYNINIEIQIDRWKPPDIYLGIALQDSLEGVKHVCNKYRRIVYSGCSLFFFHEILFTLPFFPRASDLETKSVRADGKGGRKTEMAAWARAGRLFMNARGGEKGRSIQRSRSGKKNKPGRQNARDRRRSDIGRAAKGKGRRAPITRGAGHSNSGPARRAGNDRHGVPCVFY